MKKKAKKAQRAKPEDQRRCLDCGSCRETGRFERGEGYICVKLGKPLSRRKLWGRACGRFVPLAAY